MLRYEEQNNKCAVTLEGEMTIYTAAELKEKLLAVLDYPQELEVNLSDVSEIDSAGIQLLMMLKKERSAHQRSFSLVEHSTVILDAFETMGLVPYFGDPVIVSRN